jgi:hypothetical protein
MTGFIRESEWDRLCAEAHARGEYPPLVCSRIVPDAEYDAMQKPGPRWLAWLDREPDAGA